MPPNNRQEAKQCGHRAACWSGGSAVGFFQPVRNHVGMCMLAGLAWACQEPSSACRGTSHQPDLQQLQTRAQPAGQCPCALQAGRVG